MLLAFGAGWMTNNSDWSNELNYANLNPYANNAKAVYSPLPPTVSALPQVKEISLQEQLNAADEKDTYMELTIDENPFIVQLKEAAVEIPDSTYVEKAKIVLQYHIVTGCFSEERNAEKMVRNLKKQGFDARIVGKRKGLWTVSCNSFETKREARNALSYAQDYNAKAWILNHSF